MAGRQEKLPALSLCPGMRWAGPFDRFSNPGDGPEADGQTQHRGSNRKTDVLSHGSLLAAPYRLATHICRIGANRCDGDHMLCVSDIILIAGGEAR